jgi:hypothetical protein
VLVWLFTTAFARDINVHGAIAERRNELAKR